MESIAYINALQAQATDLGNAVNRRRAELSEAKNVSCGFLTSKRRSTAGGRGSSRPRTNVGRFYSP